MTEEIRSPAIGGTAAHAASHEDGGSDELDLTGLAGAGSPSEILDIPTAELDDTLVLAPDGAGGVEFRAETGAGAPAGAQYIVGAADGGLSAERARPDLYKNYDPDNYPTSGLTLSDEFDDSSLDGAWTWSTAPAGAVSESQFPGYLWMDDGTNATAVGRDLRRTFAPGAGAFSVATKVALSMDNGSFTSFIGIALLTSADGSICSTLLASDGTATGAKAFRIVATGGNFGPFAPPLSANEFIYLLITRDASNVYNFYFSANGIIWHRTGGATVATTVDKVSIGFGGDTDTNHLEALVDFVRVFDSVTRKIGA